jgi:phage FluMu gp28-like protein
MPTASNPYIAADEIEAARQDMSEAAFLQEFEAIFVNWEGSVFRRILEAATAPADARPDPTHVYVVGVDWGRSVDYTVMVVFDATAKTMVALDRSNRVDYIVQRGRLQALYEKWRPRSIVAESNPIAPFTTTNATKANIVETLALAFERGDIRILNDPILIAELQSFQAEKLPSGLMRYTAPPGSHDDCVIAICLAWAATAFFHAHFVQPQRPAVVYLDLESGRFTTERPTLRLISPI